MTPNRDAQRQLLRLTLLASALAAANAAMAQDAPAPAAAASAPARPTELQEVTVSAQKRVQSIQKTPMAVSAVSGEEIADKALNTVDAVLRSVPGVEVQGLAQGAQVYIRGVGSSIDPTFADPAVALMVDGTYLGRTESAVGGTYDIDHVEVLSGPQGTLYGRNASGGVVNVFTSNPVLGKFEGAYHQQVGNYHLFREEAELNVPLGASAAFRVAGFKERHKGYVDDGSMDADDGGVRVKLRDDPMAGVSVVAKAEFYREDGHGMNTVPVAGSAGKLTFPPPYFATNFDPTITNGPPFTGGVPIWRFPDGWQTGSGSPWSNDSTHPAGTIRRLANSFSLQADADLGWGQLTLLPSYTRDSNNVDSSFLFGTLSGFQLQNSINTYRSMEARLASPAAAKVKWLLGLYHMDTTASGYLGDSSVVGNYDVSYGQLPGRTNAIFGQATAPVTDTFRVTAGLRFSKDHTALSSRVVDTTDNSVSVDVTDNDVSSSQYKLGIEVDLAREAMLYAHVATGFKQGGVSPSVPGTPYKPENLRAFEVGLKSRFLDNTLQVNAALFDYDYKHYQLMYLQTLEIGNTGQTFSQQVVTNATSPGTNIGAELGVQWLATTSDVLRVGLAWLDAKYGDVTLPNNPFVNQGDYSLKGHQVQNSPRFSMTLGLDHTFALDDAAIVASLSSKISSSFYVTPEQYLPGALQKSYTRTDLSVQYKPDSDRWSAGVWARNLENKAQTTYVFPAYRRFVTAPRTLGVDWNIKF